MVLLYSSICFCHREGIFLIWPCQFSGLIYIRILMYGHNLWVRLHVPAVELCSDQNEDSGVGWRAQLFYCLFTMKIVIWSASGIWLGSLLQKVFRTCSTGTVCQGTSEEILFLNWFGNASMSRHEIAGGGGRGHGDLDVSVLTAVLDTQVQISCKGLLDEGMAWFWKVNYAVMWFEMRRKYVLIFLHIVHKTTHLLKQQQCNIVYPDIIQGHQTNDLPLTLIKFKNAWKPLKSSALAVVCWEILFVGGGGWRVEVGRVDFLGFEIDLYIHHFTGSILILQRPHTGINSHICMGTHSCRSTAHNCIPEAHTQRFR